MVIRCCVALWLTMLASLFPVVRAAEIRLRVPAGRFPPEPSGAAAAADRTPGNPPAAEFCPVAQAEGAAAEFIATGDPGRLTLAELEQIALTNNPTLVQAAMRMRALRGKYLQVGLYPNPITGYVGEDIGDTGTAGQQGAFLSQRFVTAGKLRLNRAVAGHQIQEAQYAWQIQRWRVLNDVRAGCYEVLLAQRTIELDEQLLRVGQASVRVAEDLLKAMEVSRVDVLQARVEANSARLQLGNARNRYLAAWRKLAMVLGVPQMPPTPLADELENHLPEFAWEQSVARLLSESPELARAEAGVGRARCALAREYAGRIPDLDVQGAVRYNHASDETITTVEIGLPLQIFDRNQGNIAKAQAEVAAAEEEVRRVELQLQQRLADAFQQYADARQQVGQYLAEILPDAKQSLELVRAGYEQGEFGYLTLLTAQRTYFRVNKAYIDSLRELWIGSVKIEGMLISGGLQAAGSFRPSLSILSRARP